MSVQETDRTDEEREFAAISEADIWEEARDRLQICMDAESVSRQEGKQAAEFRLGRQ